MSKSGRTLFEVVVTISISLFAVFCLVILISWLLYLPNNSYLGGYLAAQRDLSKGRLIVLSPGLPVSYAFTARENLKKRFGIELRFTGCVVSDGFERFVQGYNSQSEAAIESRFGKATIAQAYKDAKQESELSHPKTESALSQ
jgi:hypothetical protein